MICLNLVSSLVFCTSNCFSYFEWILSSKYVCIVFGVFIDEQQNTKSLGNFRCFPLISNGFKSCINVNVLSLNDGLPGWLCSEIQNILQITFFKIFLWYVIEALMSHSFRDTNENHNRKLKREWNKILPIAKIPIIPNPNYFSIFGLNRMHPNWGWISWYCWNMAWNLTA